MKRRLDLDPADVPLPKGTRVVLTADVPARDGWVVKHGSVARVQAVDHPHYEVQTPDGHVVDVVRGGLVVQQARLEDVAGERAWAWEQFADAIVLEVVVGSTAWGLDDASSDEDVRGVFLLPFDHQVGLWTPPDELQPAGREAQYWEVEKLIRVALRADANALELLWTPLVKRTTPVGDLLRARRELFVSKRIHGAFGRYAISQLHKLQRRMAQHETEGHVLDVVAAMPDATERQVVQRLVTLGLGDAQEVAERLRRVTHATFDRGLIPSRRYDDLRAHLAAHRPTLEPYRPKNAYNLLRLLHSALRWATDGAPMIRVEDPVLRDRLLAIKRGEADLDGVIAEAQEVAGALDAAIETSDLPEEPDLDGADALLRACRTVAARRHFGLGGGVTPAWGPPVRRAAPPVDVDLDGARPWLERLADGRDVLLVALTGAHQYGFASADSDLDLKGIWLAPASTLLGLSPDLSAVDRTEVVDGVELDATLQEAGAAVALLLKGNGNLLERLVSPWQVLPRATDPRVEALRALAVASVHRGSFRHYHGFLGTKRAEIAASPTLKGWLYAYRVALTGIHLLATGEVVAHLPTLADRYGLPQVHDLVAAKQEGAEKAGVGAVAALAPTVARDLDRLEAQLVSAWEQSPLPDVAPNRDALQAWLVRARTGWR